jgi:hypothetical protein
MRSAFPWIDPVHARIDHLFRHAHLAQAARLGFRTAYFGTDGPGFYTRLGAELHEQVTPEFCIMRFPLPA